MLEEAHSSAPISNPVNPKLVSLAAILVPIAGNLLAIAIWLPLLRVEPGSSVRPMLQSVVFFAIVFPTAIIGSFIAFGAMPNGIKRLSGWLCFIFSCGVFFTGGFTLRLILSIRHLSLAP